jgi:hypothetical protein
VSPFALILATGGFTTVTTVLVDVAVQLLMLVCTLYGPLWATVILCVVAPLLQRYELAAEAVKVTVDPWQMVVAPAAVTVAAVGEITVIGLSEVALQPLVPTTE